MPSYLITGVSRGIGFEFLKQLSRDQTNVIIGLVRDKAATEEKVAKELGKLDNVYIIQADLTKYQSLKDSVAVVDKIVGGRLDYIIANAGLVSTISSCRTFTSLAARPEDLENDLLDNYRVNVVGNVHLFNLYVPLVLKGDAKKVITLSSGHADVDAISKYDISIAGSYSASKAAMNVIVAKFSAEYRRQGVLFLSISPGVVDTGNQGGELSEEEQSLMKETMESFLRYNPAFTGRSTPEDSVKNVLDVVNRADISRGDAGAFVSHFGNKQWI